MRNVGRAVVVYPPMVLPTFFHQSCFVLIKELQKGSTRRRGRAVVEVVMVVVFNVVMLEVVVVVVSVDRGRGGGRDRGDDRPFCRNKMTYVLRQNSEMVFSRTKLVHLLNGKPPGLP